ncbi:zinc finger ccch domain-containing protein [Anaeramoeba flamelloides]|uniref:Zinc finger ccch domain-containing protein n=1 Tax=Anaeramoeba flamelloides TaxID=1746091 RepID=A0AAV7Z8A4_9EUKA|nr:zinc finger ccch domain-containing protein [Anaeramoeba flamelloides]
MSKKKKIDFGIINKYATKALQKKRKESLKNLQRYVSRKYGSKAGQGIELRKRSLLNFFKTKKKKFRIIKTQKNNCGVIYIKLTKHFLEKHSTEDRIGKKIKTKTKTKTKTKPRNKNKKKIIIEELCLNQKNFQNKGQILDYLELLLFLNEFSTPQQLNSKFEKMKKKERLINKILSKYATFTEFVFENKQGRFKFKKHKVVLNKKKRSRFQGLIRNNEYKINKTKNDLLIERKKQKQKQKHKEREREREKEKEKEKRKKKKKRNKDHKRKKIEKTNKLLQIKLEDFKAQYFQLQNQLVNKYQIINKQDQIIKKLELQKDNEKTKTSQELKKDILLKIEELQISIIQSSILK